MPEEVSATQETEHPEKEVAADNLQAAQVPQIEMAIGRVLVAWYQYTMSEF